MKDLIDMAVEPNMSAKMYEGHDLQKNQIGIISPKNGLFEVLNFDDQASAQVYNGLFSNFYKFKENGSNEIFRFRYVGKALTHRSIFVYSDESASDYTELCLVNSFDWNVKILKNSFLTKPDLYFYLKCMGKNVPYITI